MADEKTARIASALGRVPSGCAILTARAGSRRTGMLASWIQQAAFEPPMISISVRKERPIESLIDESAHFVINILGEKPGPMFKHFGKGFGPDENAFAGLETNDIHSGVVIEDRAAFLACRVHGKHDVGDHWMYLAEVIDADATVSAQPYVHLRKNGLSY